MSEIIFSESQSPEDVVTINKSPPPVISANLVSNVSTSHTKDVSVSETQAVDKVAATEDATEPSTDAEPSTDVKRQDSPEPEKVELKYGSNRP